MNRKQFFLCCVATPMLLWPTASLAQRQTAVGPGVIPLSAAGVLNGVDMSGSATTGTLSVGVVGGPEMDIYTQNNPLVAGQLAVSTAASSQGNIVFNSSSTVFGGIGVTQPGGPFLLNIAGGATGSTVNFEGPVYATTLDVTGTGSMNFNSGSTNITATNFAADGAIGLAPNTTVIGALTTTAGADTGTLSLGGGSVLNGAVGGAVGLKAINVVGGSNLAGVSASISGAVDAYSFSLGTNTLNIGGALTIANGGTGGVINTTLASPSLYGNIRPVGATNLGPTLQVNVTVPSTAYIAVGSSFNIVQTSAGTVQSGTNGSVVKVTIEDPTNPLYSFVATPAAGTVAGLVTITTTSIPLLAPIQPTAPGAPPPPAQPIAAPVVPVLLAITPTTDLATVLAAINNLTTAPAVISAVAQLAPSTSALAAPQVTFEGTRQFENLWLSRLDGVMCAQAGQPRQPGQSAADQSCPISGSDSGWWARGFGYFGDQGAQGPFTGYSSSITGGMIGYDTPLAPLAFGGETRVGLGVGYERSVIVGKTFEADTDSDTYQVTAYIAHERGPWYIDGDVAYGWNDYSGLRQIQFPGIDRTAQSKYGGHEATAYVTTGYHLFAGRFVITPLASLQYTRLDLNGYVETGAGDIDLRVKSQRYDFLESALGVMVGRPVATSTGTIVPEAHVKWFHELINPDIRDSAAFTAAGSPSFVTPGLTTADNTFNPGVGLTFISCGCTSRTWSLGAAYDYYWRDDQYSAQRIMAKFTMRF